MRLTETLPYVNARLRGRKSRLLGGDRIRAIARAGQVVELVKELGETPYGLHLDYALGLGLDDFRAADRALARGLASDLAAVRGFADGLDRSPLRALFDRWDLANLLTVLRGVKAHVPPEKIIASCLPAGWVSENLWLEVAHSAGVEEAVDRALTLKVGFDTELRRGWARFRESKRWETLEAELEGGFFSRWRELLDGPEWSGQVWRPAHDALALEADARNLRALLEQALRRGLWLLENPVAGGRMLTRRSLREVAGAGEPATVLAALVRSGFSGGEVRELAATMEEDRLAEALNLLELHLWRRQAARLSGPPLSLELVIGYVWAKAAEVADLRRILWGLDFGLPPGRAAGMLLTA